MIGKNDLRCQTQIKMSQGESRRQGVHSISRPSGMGISREVLAGTKKHWYGNIGSQVHKHVPHKINPNT